MRWEKEKERKKKKKKEKKKRKKKLPVNLLQSLKKKVFKFLQWRDILDKFE